MDLNRALAAVPPRQRATLVLRFHCDLSVEQTAQALGLLRRNCREPDRRRSGHPALDARRAGVPASSRKDR